MRGWSRCSRKIPNDPEGLGGRAASPGSSVAGTEVINPDYGTAVRSASQQPKKAQRMEPWCPDLSARPISAAETADRRGGFPAGAGPTQSGRSVMEPSAPDPNDNLQTVPVRPKSSRSMNPHKRPTPPANLYDNRSSVRESPAPKGKGKPKGEKGRGDEGGSDFRNGKGMKGKGDRTRSPPARRDDGQRRR